MIEKIKLYPSIKMLETNLYDYQQTINWKQTFYLEEKLDGSNITFIKYNNQLYCFSRNQLITPEAFKDWNQFMEKWGNLIKQNLQNGQTLNAEYIKQGRIKYVFDENTIPNLVLFDLGTLNQPWIDYLFNNANQPNEEQVPKITFYPLDVLKTQFANTPFKFATINDVQIEPIFDDELQLSDIIVKIDGKSLRWSDQIESYLEEHYFKGYSQTFNKTNQYEGVILKSQDGQIRLKYVFKAWKNLRKTKSQKQLANQDIDQQLKNYLTSAINDRWEKLFNYLYWNTTDNNPFKSQSAIIKMINQNRNLINELLKYKSWIYEDIFNELGKNDPYDVNYFKNHQQIIMRLIHKIMKKQLLEQLEQKGANRIKTTKINL